MTILHICPPHLSDVAILPCEIQKVIQRYYSYILQVIRLFSYVRSEQTATVVLQLSCLLTVV